MGSPYNAARIVLSGEFVPDLEGEFQDVGLVADGGRTCYLVEWRIEGGEPGFVVWRLSEDERIVQKSARITGCCDSLWARDGGLHATAWTESSAQRVVEVAFRPL
jgi:hypothetical protein